MGRKLGSNFNHGRLDPLTTSFARRAVAAGATASAIQVSATERFIRTLREKSVLSAVPYLLCTVAAGGYTGCNVLLIDTGSVGNATLSAFVTGDWSSSGLLSDGASKYIDTGFNPSTQGLTATNAHFSTWHTSITVPVAAYPGHGAQDDGGIKFSMFFDTGPVGYIEIGSNIASTSVVVGLLLANAASGNLRFLMNNVLSNSVSSGGAVPNRALSLLAINFWYGVFSYLIARLLFFHTGTGLTTTQETDLYNALNTYKTDLGA